MEGLLPGIKIGRELYVCRPYGYTCLLNVVKRTGRDKHCVQGSWRKVAAGATLHGVTAAVRHGHGSAAVVL